MKSSKTKFWLFHIVIIWIFTISFSYGQQIVISEIMTSNGSTISDEDGDFEDWIEIYNYGQDAINLSGFGLSDDLSKPFRWRFPEKTIEPGEYLLVWASGKDRLSPTNHLHTNFSISSAGEPIVISNPDGASLDMIDAVSVPRDFSYGRFPDMGSDFYFFSEPTPGASNSSDIYLGILDNLDISINKSGDKDYIVSFSHPDPEAVILYALDGTDPLKSGLIYEEPVLIVHESQDALMNIRTVPPEVSVSNYGWIEPNGEFQGGVTIRGVATKSGFVPSATVGRTLFEKLPDFPVVAISANNNDFFDDTVGIYVPGLIYQQNGFNWSNPWGLPNANYFQDGAEWERPISIEFIYPEGKYHARELGVRMHGSGSRALPQKSLRLYPRSTNGDEAIEFDVFQNGESGYKRLILRTSGQDAAFHTTLFRDAVIHRVFKHMNMEDQLAQPILLFLNGEYWGIHNIRERFDVNYLERRYGIDPDLVDYLEFDGGVKEGNVAHYLGLKEYLLTNDMSDDDHMEHLKTLMDVDNFLNYQVAQIYSSNYDWPGNNNEYWRIRTDYNPENGPGLDGRWRWVFKDIDSGFGMHDHPGISYNMLAHALEDNGPLWPNPPWSTQFLRALLNNSDFKNQFINRFCDEMNTSLLPDRVTKLINDYAMELTPFISDHCRRWGRPSDSNQWSDNVNSMIDYATERPEYQRQHLRDYFNLAIDKEVTLDISPYEAGVIKINSIVIYSTTPGVGMKPYPWTGTYFSDVPVLLEAIPAPGYTFSHWEGIEESLSNPVKILPSRLNQQITAVFIPNEVEQADIIHYYHFNDLNNPAVLDEVPPDSSKVEVSAITYTGSGSGYMDDVNDGTSLLALTGVNPGRALRVRNPSQNRNLVFKLPTVGYGQLSFRYAAKRTNNGARQQVAFYRTSTDGTWQFLTDTLFITPEWQAYRLNLTGIDGVNNNPDLEIMLRFLGDEAGNSSGNNRFDNVTLAGIPLSVSPETDPIINDVHVYPNPAYDHITINMVAIRPLLVKMQLFDISGKLVREFNEIAVVQGRNFITQHISPLPAGQYILSINADGQHFTRPIIVN